MLLQMALFHSLLWVSNTVFHCVYVPPLLYSSVNGHVGCFHGLPVVNSDAMNIGVHVSFQITVFSPNICPRVGLLDLMVILFLVF